MTWQPAWDYGLEKHVELVETSTTFLAVDVGFVADKVLRAVTGGAEDDYIGVLIRAATRIGERHLQESITPKTLRLVLDGFPTVAEGSGRIELSDPPVREILAIEYYDGDQVVQSYGAGSPPSWVLTNGLYVRPTLTPAAGEVWPTTGTRADAVAVTYLAGYESPNDVPAETRIGIAFLVGEMYRNPSLANIEGQVANQLNLNHFFPRRW